MQNVAKSLECKIKIKVTRSRYLPSTSRRSTIQGLDVEGLIVEGIWKGDVKGAKVNGVQNTGQGH